MFLRVSLFLAVCCYLNASTWTGIGGIGYDAWIEGNNANLLELEEYTAYAPDDVSATAPYYTAYSNTSYRLEGSVSFDVSDNGFVVVGDDEPIKTFEIELINEPLGMTIGTNNADRENGYTINWTAPLVSVASEFEFTVRASIVYDDQHVETLEGSIALTVIPSLPRIGSNNLLTQGFRIRDGEDLDELYLDVYDPDESNTADQLTIESQDPRFTYKKNEADWLLEWNHAHPAPIVSEILPLRFWMRDWDGTQTRWTLGEQDLMLFGYDYELATIEAPSPTEESYFGRAVELMDPLPGAPVTAFIQEGDWRRVHVYEQSSETGAWQLKQTLESPEEDIDFGGSIASLEDLLVVGAIDSYDPLNCRVFIYQRANETGEWSRLQTLIPDDEIQAGNFGGKVTLDKTPTGPNQYIYTLMVSADGAASEGESTGAVWVYEAPYGESPAFAKTQIIVPDDAEEDDYFGWPLALHGDLAAIPANEDDDLWSESGAVYVYRRNTESGIWNLEQKLKASNASYDDLFGERVAISDRGIFVSAFRKMLGNTRVGAVYQFEQGESGWTQTRQIRTVEEASVDEYIYWDYSPYIRKEYTVKHFGSSLAIEGDTLLICGLRQGYGWDTLDRSMVYQFQWDDAAGDWQEVRALCSRDSDQPDTQGDLGNNFGNAQALALKGDTILAGDLGVDLPGLSDAGRVYSFSSTAPIAVATAANKETFFATLAGNAPDQSSPTDDADGDGWLNIVEFHSGTDPIVANPAPLSSLQHADYPQLPTFSFLSSRIHAQARPKVMYSRSLDLGSWTELSDARYLPDLKLGDSVQKTIDLSPYSIEAQPLFLRLQYPVAK